MLRDLATIVNCYLCDSYAMLTIQLVDLASQRGKKGKKQAEDKYYKIQEELSARKVTTAACATCIEATTGQRYKQWLSTTDRNSETLMSLVRFATFGGDPLPTLYVDMRAGAAQKPKWKLVSGLGPAGIELDSSRSGRIHKPSLRPAGVTEPKYDVSQASPDDHKHAHQKLEDTLRAAGKARTWNSVIHALEPPLFPLLIKDYGAAFEEIVEAAQVVEPRMGKLGEDKLANWIGFC